MLFAYDFYLKNVLCQWSGQLPGANNWFHIAT